MTSIEKNKNYSTLKSALNFVLIELEVQAIFCALFYSLKYKNSPTINIDESTSSERICTTSTVKAPHSVQ